MIAGRLFPVSKAVSINIPSETGGLGELITSSRGRGGVTGWRPISGGVTAAICVSAGGGCCCGWTGFGGTGAEAWPETAAAEVDAVGGAIEPDAVFAEPLPETVLALTFPAGPATEGVADGATDALAGAE